MFSFFLENNGYLLVVDYVVKKKLNLCKVYKKMVFSISLSFLVIIIVSTLQIDF